MSEQDIIEVVAALIIALCLPIWVYMVYKLLPIAYDRLNAALRVVYDGMFRMIDKWADDWQKGK